MIKSIHHTLLPVWILILILICYTSCTWVHHCVHSFFLLHHGSHLNLDEELTLCSYQLLFERRRRRCQLTKIFDTNHKIQIKYDDLVKR